MKKKILRACPKSTPFGINPGFLLYFLVNFGSFLFRFSRNSYVFLQNLHKNHSKFPQKLKQKDLGQALIFSNITFLVIFFAVIFSTAITQTANSQSENFRIKAHLNFNQKFSGTVHVIDGDSIKVGKKEIRLFGLDAPEYNQTCFDEKNNEYQCGQVSRDFLVNLANGKKAECLYAEKDKYERFLSKCFINKTSINEELVKSGMAVIYNFSESDEKMDKLEESAKSQKLGIWRGAFQLPKDYRKQHPR